jgi:hypothetical protein
VLDPRLLTLQHRPPHRIVICGFAPQRSALLKDRVLHFKSYNDALTVIR